MALFKQTTLKNPIGSICRAIDCKKNVNVTTVHLKNKATPVCARLSI